MNMAVSTASGRVDGATRPFMGEAPSRFFAESGYLIVENALNRDEIDALNRDAAAICRGDHGTYEGWQGPHDGRSDDDVLRQYLCIHFPHKCSPLMRDYLAHPAIVETLTHVIGPGVKCMQSMLFIKAAGKPGQAWHQDEDYIPTRDRSLCGAWIALDDATIENGCLWVLPGSQRHGVLWPQRIQEDRQFDCAQESYGFPYRDEDAVPVEVKAGSIVFFNGYLLHCSLPNRAKSGYRRVLVNHYMSASSLLPWTGDLSRHVTFLDNVHTVAKADSRDIVMIAGTDPYAWMGVTDLHKPHVRPTGGGGCVKWAPPAAGSATDPAGP
jgi:ectoine hydroxylase-related dioxygenase (phytanoyl-CoA dioxygenase family)